LGHYGSGTFLVNEILMKMPLLEPVIIYLSNSNPDFWISSLGLSYKTIYEGFYLKNAWNWVCKHEIALTN